MATVMSQVGQGHYYVDYGGRIFKQTAEQLSHVTDRERLAQEAVRESQDDVSMPDPGSPGTLDESAETSDDDRENTAEPVPVPHSGSSHREWRPEYEVPPPEPGDPVMTRRRTVAKRPPTDDEEMRQKRLRSEPVPEL